MERIATIDSRIPLAFDPDFVCAENAVPERMEYFSKLTADDFFQLAEKNGQLVGFHIIQQQPRHPAGPLGSIVTSWVAPECRGQGVLGELKRRGEAWARERGLKQLETNVHHKNTRMLAINEAAGFSVAYLNLRKRI